MSYILSYKKKNGRIKKVTVEAENHSQANYIGRKTQRELSEYEIEFIGAEKVIDSDI